MHYQGHASMQIHGFPLGVAALALLLAGCGGTRLDIRGADAPLVAPATERQARQHTQRTGGMHVVIDLDAMELRMMDGRQVLWKGLVGTGTGLTLAGAGQEWEFSTPTGVFFVQHKEESPDWILPDWYFVKENRPIPALDSPQRRMPGGLGAAAVYLGNEIAIHGTDRPELLGRRVSHGCIRLSNENAQRLFHNVQIGTPIIIVGGQGAAEEVEVTPSTPGTPRRTESALARLSTPELFRRLDAAFADAEGGTAWLEPASLLVRRGLKDDALALRGILERSGNPANPAVRREFDTYVADAFIRGAHRAVVSLARITPESRGRAALAIVAGTMDQYPGSLDDPMAPWPTRRMPHGSLGPDGRIGWGAVEAAESLYRTRVAGGAARRTGPRSR
jgi:hypothetical protein